MTKKIPSPEQILTLQAWARSNGRTWKQALRAAWESGNYQGFAAYPYLQQVRNTFGPSWLARFKLPAEAPSADPLANFERANEAAATYARRNTKPRRSPAAEATEAKRNEWQTRMHKGGVESGE